MSEKRGPISGFDGGSKTEERKKNWRKNQPEGNWRKCDKIKIEYTIVTRSWKWRDDDEDPFIERHIAHWGIVKTATEAIKSENVGNSFRKHTH